MLPRPEYETSLSLYLLKTLLIFAILMDVKLCVSTLISISLITNRIELIYVSFGHWSLLTWIVFILHDFPFPIGVIVYLL